MTSQTKEIVAEDKMLERVFSKVLSRTILIFALFGALMGFVISQHYELQKSYRDLKTQTEINNIYVAKIAANTGVEPPITEDK